MLLFLLGISGRLSRFLRHYGPRVWQARWGPRGFFKPELRDRSPHAWAGSILVARKDHPRSPGSHTRGGNHVA